MALIQVELLTLSIFSLFRATKYSSKSISQIAVQEVKIEPRHSVAHGSTYLLLVLAIGALYSIVCRNLYWFVIGYCGSNLSEVALVECL